MAKEIDTNKLVAHVYNKIATWNNDDNTKEGLKVLSSELIEDVLNEVLDQFGKTSVKVESPEEVIQKTKEKRGWFGGFK